MKKQLQFVAAALLLATTANAQEFSLASHSSESILINHALTSELIPMEAVLIASEAYTDFAQSHDIVSMEAGAPALPFYTESVMIPHQGNVTLEVNYGSFTEYSGIEVAPSKGSLKRNILPSMIPYSFGEAYTTDAFYPGNLATATDPFIIRDTRGVTVQVNPYQYNPVTKKLRIYQNIQVNVIFNESEAGVNELTSDRVATSTFMDIYSNFYLNTDEVMSRYTPKEEDGEMLIICPDSYTDEIEDFVTWKMQEGIKTTVAVKSEVGSTDIAIKNYVEDYYDEHPELTYLLLVGDHSSIPSHTYGSSGWEELWSDSYYGQMTADYYPELFVGRFSGNQSDVSLMVDRVLEYEKTPAPGNWMEKAIGLASNEGSGYGDDGEADWQHARNNRAKLLDYGYDEVYEFYDGSHGGADAAGNPSPADISPAMDEGIGLFNYTGHGSEDVCVTGNYSSSDVNDAENTGKYPFVISVACNNGTFTSGTCISEVWTRARSGADPTGAIAACGSSILMAWAEPMQTQDELTEIIAETYTDNRKVTLGGIFYNAQMSMLESYLASGTAVEVMQTWIMFGDPSTMFRNQETQEMTVSHTDEVMMGTTSIDVTCDTEDATIAISQGGVFLGKAKVVGGVASVSVDAIETTEPLVVVGTKQNYLPYEGAIAVGNGHVDLAQEITTEEIRIYPNPASDQVTIFWSGMDTPSQITLQDVSGKIIYSVTPTSEKQEVIQTAELAAGVYIVNASVNGVNNITKLIIR